MMDCYLLFMVVVFTFNQIKELSKLNNTIGFQLNIREKLERDILSFKLIDCDTDLAEHLECKVGTPVYAIKRLMYIDDIPLLLNILTITKTSFIS